MRHAHRDSPQLTKDETGRFLPSSLPFSLPSLGDSRKTYQVQLTEPEINAIHGVNGFLAGMFSVFDLMPQSVKDAVGLDEWFATRFPVIQALSAKLSQFDDGDAPLEESSALPKPQFGSKTKESS